MSRNAKCFRLLTIGVLAAAMIGCESNDEASLEEASRVDPQKVNDEVFWDHTPELLTVTDRPDDTAGRITRRFNYDSRMFWEDWINAWYWDRPTRLNRRPIP
ncbi:MAG: hypothetical protein IT430_05500 [Phycisphaerales bacterium]|nr:hypothetical protein [Phycisphaerales bacterium]